MSKRRPKPPVRTKKKLHRSPPGAAPGNLHYVSDTLPVLTIKSYHENSYAEYHFTTLKEAFAHIDQQKGINHWLQIIGYGNYDFLKELQVLLNVHPLEMEDAITSNFRPKLEYYPGHTFSIHQMLYYNAAKELCNEQIAVFSFPNLVATLQENDFDCLNPVKDRVRIDGTLLRKSTSFYLYYAIYDAVIDNFFPLIENIEERLDRMEDILFDRPEKYILSDIQTIKRDLLTLRKNVIAERDNLNELMRNIAAGEDQKYGIYLRDAYEHCVQINDLIESQKEIAFSLIDIYLSTVNNKLSEVMKVLTIISSIFIPMSFVAGVYGMNFSQQGLHGENLPWNMPELYTPYGYLGALGVMLLIGLTQVYFFKRKGWF